MIESENKDDGTTQSYLNFIHMAGSELISDIPLTNANKNNNSLISLNFMIKELSEGKKDVQFKSRAVRA